MNSNKGTHYREIPNILFVHWTTRGPEARKPF